MPVHVEIDKVWVDFTLREVHARGADVTEHPVERGADIADHIRPRLPELQLEGIVTNTPIEVPASHLDTSREDPSPILIEGEPSVGVAGLIPGVDQGVALAGVVGIELRSKRQFSGVALHFLTEFDRVGAVWEALQQTVDGGKLVTVVTALQTYDNMAVLDLQANRDRPGVLQFGCTVRQVRVVSSDTAKLPTPVDARGKPKKSAGKKSTTAAGGAGGEPLPSSLAAKLLGI